MSKKNKKVLKVDDSIKEEAEEVLPYKYIITSYGADYTVDGLIKRMIEESIIIPSFQRAFVWNMKQSSRFIESLLLGLPVPGIFLSKDLDSQKLVVIDGQQRLKTIQYFYEGKFGNKKDFFLEGVQREFLGKSYKTLSDENRRKLDDAIIHATIIKQDIPLEDDSSIYFIFERLNTGGLILQPQEIRASIYHGPFNDFLKRLNSNKDWRFLYGQTNIRMRDQEIILRFFAFYLIPYTKPMKGFLNKFMKKNRNFSFFSEIMLEKIFCETIAIIRKSIGRRAFKPQGKFLAALADCLMVGIAKRLENKKLVNLKNVKVCYHKLLGDKDFMDAITTHTSDEPNVKSRMKSSIDIFKNV
jgi:uncharacterized protein with ParB-like and HNH nuclease domain